MKTPLDRTLYMAVLPFIPLDLLKGIIAALIGRVVAPAK
jgi:biotin transporter BioY